VKLINFYYSYTMKTVSIPTFLNINLQFELAGIGQRVGAFTLDWVIKWVYAFTISSVLGISILNRGVNPLLIIFIIYSPFIFYTFLLEWLNKGQTLGKMMVGIKVVGQEGNPPTMSQSAIRWMFLLVDCYLLYLFIALSPWLAGFAVFSPILGVVFMANSANNQRIGDLAAKTIIVKAKEKTYSINDTIYAYVNYKKGGYTPEFPEVMKLRDKDMTIIKKFLENSYNSESLNKLANHIKKILDIKSEDEDTIFLTKILEDYNHIALKQGQEI
jgi:uncharacterized RDD family membrane protein YckC